MQKRRVRKASFTTSHRVLSVSSPSATRETFPWNSVHPLRIDRALSFECECNFLLSFLIPSEFNFQFMLWSLYRTSLGLFPMELIPCNFPHFLFPQSTGPNITCNQWNSCYYIWPFLLTQMLTLLYFYWDNHYCTFWRQKGEEEHSHCPQARKAVGQAAFPSATSPKFLESASRWCVLQVNPAVQSQDRG